MPLILDFLALANGSIVLLISHHAEFAAVLSIAFAFAGLGWLAAANYSKLWNLGFRATATYALLCFVAAVLTFVFVVLFASLKYTREAAELTIDAWGRDTVKDGDFLDTVWSRSYDEVKKLGLEDFSKIPPRGEPGSYIPVNHPESKQKSAEVCATLAIECFVQRHPFLSIVAWSQGGVSKQSVARIDERIIGYFESGQGILPVKTIIGYATEELKPLLRPGAARVVPIARSILVTLFALAQLLPFGLIGWAAWRDLKVTV